MKLEPDIARAAISGRSWSYDAGKAGWPAIEDLLASAARSGEIRDDVAPGELATYCMHALAAATTAASEAAVRRLVAVTVAGLQPPP